MDEVKIESFEIDVLKEIGNIGSGNALISLSKLIKRKVDMKVPKINVLKYNEIADLMGGADNPVIGILSDIGGDIKGSIMFIMEESHATSLAGLITGEVANSISEFNDMDISALKEAGSILAGSYLSSLSQMCGIKILPGSAHYAYDMAGAILSVPAIQYGQMSDTILYIETLFNEGEDGVIGKFFLIPDWESCDVLFNALGVK